MDVAYAQDPFAAGARAESSEAQTGE
jgi:hypothetical protein